MENRKKNTGKKHHTWKGILAFASGKKRLLAFSAGLSILGVTVGIVPYILIGWIAKEYMAGLLDTGRLLFLVGCSAAACVLQGVLQGGSTLLSHRCAFRILENIRISLTEKMNRLSMGTIRKVSSGEYKNLLLDEVEKLEYPLAHAIPEMTGNLTAFLAVFILMLCMDVRLAFSALITLPVGFLIMKQMFCGYGERYAKFMKAGDNLNKVVVEYLNGIEVIKVFNQAGSTFEKMKQTVTYFKDFTLAWYRHNWPYTAAYSVILPSAIVGVLPVGVVLLNRGEIVFPTLLLFVLLSFALIPPLIKLTEFIDNVAVIVKTEQEVQDFLAQEEPRYAITPARIENFGISIEHISFSYGEETAVEDINVVIPPSGITAIVGESGSGKTTLLRLLARFWDVSKGKIYIGGTDIRDIPQDQLMGMMSIVDQDNFLFDMSIRDNIMLGKPDADDKALAASVDAAGCREIVERLEGGLHTVVGTGGALLSTGERQRICIARAILKDAPILLLDEPTASMDLENEYKVQKALQQLMSPKTVVMATHRLRTAVSAQQILVMKHGVLVGKGTHETLLEGCPEYARLWNACVCAENWSMGGDADV